MRASPGKRVCIWHGLLKFCIIIFMKQSKFVVATVTAGVFWGIISIFLKGLSCRGFSTVQVLALKAVIVTVFQFLFILFSNPANFKIRFRDLWIFAGTGIVSITFFQLCYFKSILELGASTSVILLYTSPIWVLLFSAVLFREKISVLKTAALFMTFAGCILITGFGNSSVSVKGVVIGLLSGVGYALYSVFARFALKKYSTSTLVFYTFLCNAVSLVPFAGISSIASLISPVSFLFLLGIAIICTAIPYALYSYGLSGLETGKAAILVTVEPMIGCLTGIFLWKEDVTVLKIAGILIILAAVIMMGKPSKKS